MYLVTVELSEHHDPRQVPRQDFGCLDGGPFLFMLTPSKLLPHTLTETHIFCNPGTVMVIYIQHKEGENIVFHRAQAFNYLHFFFSFFFFHVLPTTVSEKIGPK